MFFRRRCFFFLSCNSQTPFLKFKFNWAQLLPTVRQSQAMKRSCEDTLVRFDNFDDSYISHSKLRMNYVCRCLETQPIASREKENVKGKRVGVSFDPCWKENI